MLLNVKQVKLYAKQNNKQISLLAIEALENKVKNILLSAIDNTRHFKRITDVEINFTKS